MSYAKCCYPLPGDHVIGHLSAGRGIVVHRDTCKNVLQELRNSPEKCIALAWDDTVEQEFSAALRLDLVNKKGVLATLATHLSELGSNIETINMAEKDASLTIINVIITVHSRVHLAKIMRRLRALDNVIKLQRL